MLWSRSLGLLALVAAVASCECGTDEPEPKAVVLPPVVATAGSTAPERGDADESRVPRDPANVTVHQASELGDVDKGQLRRLDLALSEQDQVGHMHKGGAETACVGLDLVRLATAIPQLESLRISGCPDAIRAGLGAFSTNLVELELADLALDDVIVGRLAQLQGLQRLTLRRVEGGLESYKPLRKLDLREITLVDLKKDSDLSTTLDLWPKRLEKVVFVGRWAGHRAMLTVPKAESLRSLELRDNRMGNYSLNQIKPLEHLEEVVYVGSNFTDNSPLYFRHLPVKRFVCDCPRMGDGGLKSLRQSRGLRELELRQTAITGAGLTMLEDLTNLQRIVLTGVEIGPDGFTALAALPRLTELELAGALEDPTLEGLGLLLPLEVLTLRLRELDDRAAPQLAKLTKLRELDLSRTRISDVGLAALAGLSNLEVLKLHHTQVTRGLDHLARLSSLKVLELDHTDVVDAGVAHLRSLQALEELRLDQTLVTDASIDHLTALPNLRRLNLANTVVTEAGAETLAALPNLEVLRVD